MPFIRLLTMELVFLLLREGESRWRLVEQDENRVFRICLLQITEKRKQQNIDRMIDSASLPSVSDLDCTNDVIFEVLQVLVFGFFAQFFLNIYSNSMLPEH